MAGHHDSAHSHLLQILRTEIRPAMSDPHPKRRRLFRRREKIVVRILEARSGNELPEIRSRIRHISEQKPWKAFMQRARLAADTPQGHRHLLVEDEQQGGQFRIDMHVDVPAFSSVGDGGFPDRCRIMRWAAQVLRSRCAADDRLARQRRDLLFLLQLYERLTTEGRG